MWDCAVLAQFYIDLPPHYVWNCLTDYPLWVRYLPDMMQSRVIEGAGSAQKRLYQVARKVLLLFHLQVQAYLGVTEDSEQRLIRFVMEEGNGALEQFAAELHLQPLRAGTVISYSARAKPTVFVPEPIILAVIKLELPMNLRRLRQVMLSDVAAHAV
jgi:hypothetical protein